MNRWTRRGAVSPRVVLAALAAVGSLALAGCAAGQLAQTSEQRPTVDGANGSLGPLALRDVALEYPSAGVYAKGGNARLRMVVASDSGSTDTLVEVRTDSAREVRVTAAAGGGSGAVTPVPSATSAEPSSTPTGTSSGTPTGDSEPASPSATIGPGEPSDSPATGTSSSGSPAPSASGSASGTPAGTPTPTPAATDAPPATIQIPANGLVRFRDDGPVIELVGLTRQLRPTESLSVTFVFRTAGEITLEITVGVPEGEISPAPVVTTAAEGSEG